MTRRVATHLMFAGKASEAMELYSSIFPDFRVEKIERYEETNPNAAAYVKFAEVSFLGHDLIVIDSPIRHDFTFTPAISLFVDCQDGSELEATFRALSEVEVYSCHLGITALVNASAGARIDTVCPGN